MNPLVPALAYLLSPAFAEPRDAVRESAPVSPIAQPALVPNLAMPVAPVLAPELAPTALLENAAPLETNVPVLPQSPANALAPAVTAEKSAQPQAQTAVSDSDWLSGAQQFDKALDRPAAPVSAFIVSAEATPAAKTYASLVREASWSGWRGKGAAVSDAALTLLTERGVKAERLKFPSGHEGVQVAAEKGISPLNDLAYDLKKTLGTTMDFMPERTAGAAAAFSSRENRLLMAGLERPDFFLATLHEARHAWYASLLRKGQIRLFHAAVVAKPHLSIAPDAESYAGYMSFEELSNHAKTLKHMVTERLKMTGEAASFMEEKVGTRAYQYADLLRSSEYLAGVIEGRDRAGKLEMTRLTDSQAYNAGLDVVEGLEWFAVNMPRGTLYFPVLQRETRNLFGVRSKKASKDEALAALRLRMKLIGALVADSAAPAKAYRDAVKAKDWAAAGRAADRLIRIASDAEKAWGVG